MFFDFSFLKQIKKKMFVDFDEIWRVGRGHYGVNMLLRGRMCFNVEARNMGLNTFSFS